MFIINKTDKPNELQLPLFIPTEKIVRISAKKKQITELETKIGELFAGDLVNNLPSYPYLSHSWQQAKLARLIDQLEKITSEIKKEVYLDAICGDLETSYQLVRELSGKEYDEDLLEIIFQKFCLGK